MIFSYGNDRTLGKFVWFYCNLVHTTRFADNSSIDLCMLTVLITGYSSLVWLYFHTFISSSCGYLSTIIFYKLLICVVAPSCFQKLFIGPRRCICTKISIGFAIRILSNWPVFAISWVGWFYQLDLLPMTCDYVPVICRLMTGWMFDVQVMQNVTATVNTLANISVFAATAMIGPTFLVTYCTTGISEDFQCHTLHLTFLSVSTMIRCSALKRLLHQFSYTRKYQCLMRYAVVGCSCIIWVHSSRRVQDLAGEMCQVMSCVTSCRVSCHVVCLIVSCVTSCRMSRRVMCHILSCVMSCRVSHRVVCLVV